MLNLRIRVARRLLGALGAIALFSVAVVQAQGPAGLPNKTEVDKAYSEGLQIWRGPDLGNNSCSFCHSPDGFEIAAYNFDDETLLRRATPHLGPDAPKIVDFIHAVRRKYGLTKLLDPLKDRPLQPGGVILPGDTPDARDAAFGKSLETLLPTLATGNVDSPEAAQRAKDELLKIDPRKIPIGIPFNRISEDGFHGKDHATFAHWIADTAVVMHFPWAFYFTIHDQYLANPSNENFTALLNFAKQLQNKYTYAQQMANNKYRALLVLSHMMRMQALGKPAFVNAGPVLLGELSKKPLPDPLFELGVLTDERADSPFSAFRFPDDVLAKKSGGPDRAQQMRSVRLPSLWEGWLMDQGLQRIDVTPGDRATRIVTERLFADGPYPMHAAFLIGRKIAVQSFVPEGWNSADPQHFVLDYSAFIGDNNFRRFEPTDPIAKAAYRRFVANLFRTTMYLALADLESSKTRYARDPLMDQLPVLQAYLHETRPQDAKSVDDLVDRIRAHGPKAESTSK